MDKALRSRLEEPHTEDEEIKLVRDALIEAVNKKAEREAAKAKELSESLAERDEKIETLTNKNAELEKKVEDSTAFAEETASKLSTKDALVEGLQQRVRAMEERDQKNSRLLMRFLYCLLLIAVVTFSCFLGWLLPVKISAVSKWVGQWPATLIIATVSYVLCHLLLEWCATKMSTVSEFLVFTLARKFRKWAWGAIVLGVVLSLFTNTVQKKVDANSKQFKTGKTSSTNQTTNVIGTAEAQ